VAALLNGEPPAKSIGRHLHGEKPLAARSLRTRIQQSTKVELAIDLKTAKAHGITLPQSMLVAADEVIE
jgi:putative ABC transport system substrate-binding protein